MYTRRSSDLDIAVNMAMFGAISGTGSGGGLLGGLLKRGGAFAGGNKAQGGPVRENKSYRVGERGPETFVPSASGHIVPSSGATITVNVDASGSSVEGNDNEAEDLGKLIGIAVQNELVQQKRPGGLLAA
jgi:hypothetical protein